MIPFSPVVLYEVDAADQGYRDGARFLVEQLDGGQYAFKSRPDAELFMAMHGMDQMNEDDMSELRRVLSKNKK